MSAEVAFSEEIVVSDLLIKVTYRLTATRSDNGTYWCETFMRIGGCEWQAEPRAQFRCRTLPEAIDRLHEQVHLEWLSPQETTA